MADIVDRLRRAKGSAVLPKVMLGHKNAEATCLEAAAEIERLRAEVERLRAEVEACRDDDALTTAYFLGAHNTKRAAQRKERDQ